MCTLKSFTWLVLQNKCAIYVTCFCRPYGVHPVSAGQFPVWWGAGGAQRWAALHRIRLPKPHHPMAKRWSAVTFRLPLDAAYHWPHHFRLEARGQRQLHLRGHQQLWIQRGDRSPQRHRWVKSWRECSWAVKHHYSGSATTSLGTYQSNTDHSIYYLHCTLHQQLQMEQKSETDRGNECDVRSWTGAKETSFKPCWLWPGPLLPTRPHQGRLAPLAVLLNLSKALQQWQSRTAVMLQ